MAPSPLELGRPTQVSSGRYRCRNISQPSTADTLKPGKRASTNNLDRGIGTRGSVDASALSTVVLSNQDLLVVVSQDCSAEPR
jgi:hypothetical protein